MVGSCLDIEIDNQDDAYTFGDLRRFPADFKPPNCSGQLNSTQMLPLTTGESFVETAKLSELGARGSYCFGGTEYFMPGHFPRRHSCFIDGGLGATGHSMDGRRYQNEGLNQESFFYQE